MIQKITFLTLLAAAACLVGRVPRANAQTYENAHLSSIVLAGNGTDLSHTLTLQAPSIGSSFTLKLPTSNSLGILSNDGSGNLSWLSLGLGNLPLGSANQFLVTNSLGLLVSWQGLNISSHLSGNGVGTALDIATTYPGQTSITTLGTITSGTWNGSTVTVGHGGTGATSLTSGDLLVGNGTSAISSGPAWNSGTSTLTGNITGNAATATSATSATTTANFSGSLAGDITGTQSATTINNSSAAGGHIISALTASAGTLTNNTSGNAATATSATNFSGSLTGDVSGTQSLTSVVKMRGNAIPADAAGALTNNGAGTLSWAPIFSNPMTSAGDMIYGGSSGAPTRLAGIATANHVLLSGATAAPSWSTATYPVTTTVNQLLYSSANNGITGLATSNSGVLVTSATGVPSISATLPSVGIGVAPTSNMLAVGGNIELTNATNTKITTSSSDLVLEQTSDVYGTTRLHIQNRNGSNCALFEQAGSVNLADFGFEPGATGVQSNLRLEDRNSFIRNTANDGVGEFQFYMNTTGAGGGSPTYNFSTGEAATTIEVGNVGIGMVNPSQKLQLNNGNLYLSNTGSADQLQFQGTASGITTLQAGAQGSSNINYTLPTSAPASNGYVLSATTGGAMSWVANGSGGMSNPMTAAGDMIYSSSGSTPARLGIGTTDNFLGSNGTTPAWTNQLSLAGIGATSTDGLILVNTSNASSGTASQYSPRIRLSGAAYRSGSSSGSQQHSWIIENQPVTASGTNTTANLVLSDSGVGATGYTVDALFTSGGGLTLGTASNETGSLTLNNAFGTATSFTPSASASGASYTLPPGLPSTSGYVLSSTTGGVMSWVSNGSSSVGPVSKAKTGTTSNSSSSSYVTDGDMAGIALSASSTYTVSGAFYVGASSSSADAKIEFNYSGSLTTMDIYSNPINATTVGSVVAWTGSGSSQTVTISSSSNKTWVLYSGVIQTSSAGNLSVAFERSGSSGTITMEPGSNITLTQN